MADAQVSLDDGARVAVIGGGPAGSFFAFFLLLFAERLGKSLEVFFRTLHPSFQVGFSGAVLEALVRNPSGHPKAI